MNITGITNQALATAALQGNSASSSLSTNVQKAFAAASARLEQQRDATSAQISSVGQAASAFARVQDSGKTLAATQASTGNDALAKNLQSFVNAYNEARSTAAGTTNGGVQAASRDVQRTLSTDSARRDLQSLGITRSANGALTLDTKALASALQTNAEGVRSAASRIGGSAQQSATQSLANAGSIGGAVLALNAREQNLETRIAEQQQLAAQSQQQASASSARLSAALAGINSYNRIFSL